MIRKSFTFSRLFGLRAYEQNACTNIMQKNNRKMVEDFWMELLNLNVLMKTVRIIIRIT